MKQTTNKDYSVYVHEFPNGKVYVGLTHQDVNQRWQSGNGYKKQPVYEAIKEVGWDNIKHYVISGLSKEEAKKKECELISKFDSIQNGYNISSGGGCGGEPWNEFYYNGRWYNSNELALISPVDGIKPHDITNRINSHGFSIEDALTKPIIKKNQVVRYNGKDYTYKELVNNFSLNDELCADDICNRINKGWEIERAITQPKGKKKQPYGIGEKKYLLNGKRYNSYELWEKRKDPSITQSIIVNRINQHGWSVEDAISKPPKRYGLLYEYNGKYFTTDELAKIYPENKLEKRDITDRLRNGWSIKDTVETPKSKRKLYNYDGEYLSLQQIYERISLPNKVSYSTFASNVKNGQDIIDAIKRKK